ncbi:PDDEXK family nuclease [Rufibacter roseus]|uniref:DUF5655 domain-containing protein n=1 Tax=Rufibacter roseus TaxID=1567108 RepID=A0ABW2DQE6_9BACT|nr:hypothetical protein [Rufibacter roseus]
MTKLTFTTAEKLNLKTHPDFNEIWLQDRIAENPQIIGLGELELIDRERKQHKSGRLDLLLADFENNARYEVELQLGQTDESHIIRCIEYWDVEKRRYPQYDHCGVLIAEDITSRFLNVLGLFNGHIPLIIIQITALKVGGNIVLNFTKVMDRFALRNDDIVESKLAETDRNYWNNRSTPKNVEIVDKLLEIINEKAEPKLKLNYNKYYIGLSDGYKSRNFIHFKPKKQFTNVLAEIENPDEWIQKLEDEGVSAVVRDKWLRFAVTTQNFDKKKKIVTDLIQSAVELYNKD